MVCTVRSEMTTCGDLGIALALGDQSGDSRLSRCQFAQPGFVRGASQSAIDRARAALSGGCWPSARARSDRSALYRPYRGSCLAEGS